MVITPPCLYGVPAWYVLSSGNRYHCVVAVNGCCQWMIRFEAIYTIACVQS